MKSNRLPILASRELCTGCSACQNMCPTQCIDMVLDDDGFLVPIVNAEECTLNIKAKCGICELICPITGVAKSHEKAKEHPKCYAIQADDSERRLSSSGGVVPVFAKYILNKPEGGFVYGAAWNENFEVVHIEVSNEVGLNRIRGSKYIQSNTLDTYKKARKRLKEGHWVLFTGTPCEIAGLNAVLGNVSREKLVTIDLVCHGVASQKVFKKFIEDNNIDTKDLMDIKFRDKRINWIPNISLEYRGGG